MQNFNLHTHSIYSDGKSQPREIVEEAVRQGLTTLGFSEHSPLPFDNNFSVKEANMPKYVAEIAQLKAKFKGKIDIYCGLEADYLTGVSEPFAVTKEKYHLDYLIGGVHLVGQSANPDEIWFIDGPKWEVYDEGLQKFFDGDIHRAVRRFFEQSNEMIENESFDIIAHFDKIKMHNRDRYFHEDEPWYRKLALETLDLIREKGLIMEIKRLLSLALADGGGLQDAHSRHHLRRRAPFQRNHIGVCRRRGSLEESGLLQCGEFQGWTMG